MRKSLPRLKDVPRYGSVAKSVRDGRGVIFVLSGDPTCHEFSIGKGGRKSAKARVLYKQSTKESKRTIPVNREASLCIDNSFQEAKALLPSSCHQFHDRSSAQESNEQARSYWTTRLSSLVNLASDINQGMQ